MIFQVAPPPPSNLLASATATGGILLTWTDNSVSETGFTLQRATDANFTTPIEVLFAAQPGYGTVLSYTDTTATGAPAFFYRVKSVDDFTPYSPLPAPWQNATMASAWSNVVQIAGLAPVAGISPASLTFALQVVNTTSASQAVTLSNTGTPLLQSTASR